MDSNENNSAKEYDSTQLMIPKSDELPAFSGAGGNFLNPKILAQMERAAKIYSDSSFVPDHFRGKPANVLIAMDMAILMNMNPFMLMRTMYVVHGKPGFEAQFSIALMNKSGLFVDPLEYEWRSEQGKPDWGCRAFAVRKSTRKKVEGPWVDWKMVVANGWNVDKPLRDGKGIQKSKWNTMPEVMFRYRAASLFGRVNCPDLLMGMSTYEELQDYGETDLRRQPDGSYAMAGTVNNNWKPTADTYKATATAPEPAPAAETKSDDQAPPPAAAGQADEHSDDFIPEVLVDEFGTPKKSPWEKSKWFFKKKGNMDGTSGLAQYVQQFSRELSDASNMTFKIVCEKYESFYDREMPYGRDGHIKKQHVSDPDHEQGSQGTPDQPLAAQQTTDSKPSPEQQQASQGGQDQAANDLFDSNAAKLLATMAGKHKREYIMVVQNRVPESTEQIFDWLDQINTLVVKHANEPPPEGEKF